MAKDTIKMKYLLPQRIRQVMDGQLPPGADRLLISSIYCRAQLRQDRELQSAVIWLEGRHCCGTLL